MTEAFTIWVSGPSGHLYLLEARQSIRNASWIMALSRQVTRDKPFAELARWWASPCVANEVGAYLLENAVTAPWHLSSQGIGPDWPGDPVSRRWDA